MEIKCRERVQNEVSGGGKVFPKSIVSLVYNLRVGVEKILGGLWRSEGRGAESCEILKAGCD